METLVPIAPMDEHASSHLQVEAAQAVPSVSVNSHQSTRLVRVGLPFSLACLALILFSGWAVLPLSTHGETPSGSASHSPHMQAVAFSPTLSLIRPGMMPQPRVAFARPSLRQGGKATYRPAQVPLAATMTAASDAPDKDSPAGNMLEIARSVIVSGEKKPMSHNVLPIADPEVRTPAQVPLGATIMAASDALDKDSPAGNVKGYMSRIPPHLAGLAIRNQKRETRDYSSRPMTEDEKIQAELDKDDQDDDFKKEYDYTMSQTDDMKVSAAGRTMDFNDAQVMMGLKESLHRDDFAKIFGKLGDLL